MLACRKLSDNFRTSLKSEETMHPAKFLLAAVATLVAAATAAPAKEVRPSDVHPLDYPTVQGRVDMGKRLGERTVDTYRVKGFRRSTPGSQRDRLGATKTPPLER